MNLKQTQNQGAYLNGQSGPEKAQNTPEEPWLVMLLMMNMKRV